MLGIHFRCCNPRKKTCAETQLWKEMTKLKQVWRIIHQITFLRVAIKMLMKEYKMMSQGH